jgi:hypothetical protein
MMGWLGFTLTGNGCLKLLKPLSNLDPRSTSLEKVALWLTEFFDNNKLKWRV